jgi:uncharacterized protein (TIGR02145 family)
MTTRFSLRRVATIVACLAATALFASCGGAAEDDGGDKVPDMPDEVVINGVTWATRNVDAPSTFAATHLDIGMYYQWGSSVGWSSSEPMASSPADVVWDNDYVSNVTNIKLWPSNNDPCPTGWRLPSKADFDALCDNSKVSGKLTQIASGKGATFTDIASGNAVFFPYSGGRARDGELANSGTSAAYWTNEQYENNMYSAYYMNSGAMTGNAKGEALCVRCVKE